MTYDPSFPSEPPVVDPTAPASSPESPAPTGSSSRFLTGILADDELDLESWTPDDGPSAEQAIAAVADYCRDYCPVRLQCVEEACRLYRLEARADAVLRQSPSESVGVLGQQVIGL